LILIATLGVGAWGTVLASTAAAGCVPGLDIRRPSIPRQTPAGARYVPAGFTVNPNQPPTSIVGFWEVVFVARGNPPGGVPDDVVVDSAYVQWHSDGTEIMNSARAPMTGSFCLGVWEKTGPFSYTLNHLAKSWSADGSTFVGPASIREDVVLGPGGDTYQGTFTITQYDTNEKILPPTPIVGVVIARRITAQ
jgi:hypothetical protein